MCGTAGKIYFDNNRDIRLHEMIKMTNAIVHRGTDERPLY